MVFRTWWITGQRDIASRWLGERGGLVTAVEGWVHLVMKATAISVDSDSGRTWMLPT